MGTGRLAWWTLVLVACTSSQVGHPEVQGPDAGEPDALIDLPADRPDAEVPVDGPQDPGIDPGADTPGEMPLDASDLTPLDPPLPADLFGMCPMDGDPPAERWDAMRGWGVRVVRQGFFWEWISRPDGSLDFSWPDRYFEEASRRGIGVLVVLDYDHPSLHAPDAPRPSIPAEGHDRWLAYVRAVATRYRDRAWGFEVWNEPNLPNFWKGTQAEFVALARVTVQAVHEAAPGVPVAVAGFSLLPLDWLDALHAEGVLAAADALSFHPYWVDAEGALEMVDLVRQWMNRNGLQKPLWLTEYGWPTGGDYLTATDLDGQAERLLRFVAGCATAGVRAAWWYASHDHRDPDQTDADATSEAFFGVAWPSAGDKPAARAFALLARRLPGSRLLPDPIPACMGGQELQCTAFLGPDGSRTILATNPNRNDVVLLLPGQAVVEWPEGAVSLQYSEVVVPAERSIVWTEPPGAAAP